MHFIVSLASSTVESEKSPRGGGLHHSKFDGLFAFSWTSHKIDGPLVSCVPREHCIPSSCVDIHAFSSTLREDLSVDCTTGTGNFGVQSWGLYYSCTLSCGCDSWRIETASLYSTYVLLVVHSTESPVRSARVVHSTVELESVRTAHVCSNIARRSRDHHLPQPPVRPRTCYLTSVN